MTRCYEYYCLFKRNPEKCELDRSCFYQVHQYMKFMREKGVKFDGQPTDKGLFYAAQEKYGSERAWIRVRQDGQDGFEACLYNIWSFNSRDPRFGEANHPWGIIAGQIVQNLLHYYTEKGDLVLDPMAGTGVTIDVCRGMDRRWRAYDLQPARPEIEANDIIVGLPEPWGEAQLAVLDPPYFTMKGNHYPSIEAYYQFLEVAIENTAKGLQLGGYLALILLDQTNKGATHYPLIGPAYQFLCAAGLHYENLVGLPLPTQQYRGYDVKAAREKRQLLGINRQMWVFRKPGGGAA